MPSLGRLLELSLVFALGASAAGLVTALMGAFSVPLFWLAGSAAVVAWASLLPPRPESPLPRGIRDLLILVLLIAAALRLPVYDYVFGGQDQGIYTTIGDTLLRTGGIVPSDPMATMLSDARHASRYLEDNYQPDYLPAVYSLDRRQTGEGLEFQFYHLWPVWMAAFSGIFGPGQGALALTVFALLGVLAMFRLAAGLTDSGRAGLAAAALLAINPLHAFFSKFSVTEVCAVAWALLSFALLVDALRAPTGRPSWRLLALSVLALGGLFFTRISGFFFLPLLAAIAAGVLVWRTEPAYRRAILGWLAGSVLIYAASVVYGLAWSSSYSADIYRNSFSRVLGAHWGMPLTALGIGATIALALLERLTRREVAGLRRLWSIAQRALPIAAALLVVGLGVEAYRIAFTDDYATHRWIGVRWKMAGGGWDVVGGTIAGVSVIYLTPFLVVAALSLLGRAGTRAVPAALLFFIVLVLGYLGYLFRFVPYQPYYARYLLSELVPCVLLFVVVGWHSLAPGWRRRAVALLLVAGGVQGAAVAARQIGDAEGRYGRESLQRLTADIGPRDLILLDTSTLGGGFANEIKTPLAVAQGRKVVSIGIDGLSDAAYLGALIRGADATFLIRAVPDAPEGFRRVDAVRFLTTAFTHGQTAPDETFLRHDLLLTRFRLESLPTSTVIHGSFVAGSRGTQWLADGWSSPEDWGTWSVGAEAVLRVPAGALPCENACQLELDLRAFVGGTLQRQRVSVVVDGALLETRVFDASAPRATVVIPVPTTRADPLEIRFRTPDAGSPKAAGIGGDARVLGVGLTRSRIRPVPADAAAGE